MSIGIPRRMERNFEEIVVTKYPSRSPFGGTRENVCVCV